MDFSVLPPAETKVVSGQHMHIAGALSVIAQTYLYTHFEPIQGMKSSGRLLLTQPRSSAAAFPAPLPASEMAKSLKELEPQARYEPEEPPAGYEKGWAIRQTLVDGHPAAIALAGWVKKGS